VLNYLEFFQQRINVVYQHLMEIGELVLNHKKILDNLDKRVKILEEKKCLKKRKKK